MARKDIEAGNAFVRLTLQDNAFIRSLSKNSERLKSFGTGMAKIGAGITGLGASVLGPLLGAVKVFADVASELDDMSLRTGVSVEALSELGHAAEMSGSDLGTVEKAIMKMQKTLGADIGKGASEALKEIGLDAKALQALSPEQQFEQIAAGLSKVEDPTKRAALAMQLLGKSGTALLPMIADLEALREEARELGYVMSTDSAKNGAALGDMFDNLWKTVKYGVVAIGDALAPAVLKIGGILQKVMTAGLKWIQDNKQLVLTVAAVAAGVTAAGLGITGLGLAIAGAGIVLGGLVSGLSALGTVLGVVLSPLGLIAGLLAAGIYLWATYSESGQATVGGLVSLLGELWTVAKDTFGGIYDAIASGDLALAGEIAMAGLRLALLKGLDALSASVGGVFGDFIGTLGMNLIDGDLSGAWETVLSGLSSMTAGFVNGALDMWANLKNGFLSIANDMWTGIKSLFVEGGRTLFNSLITLGEVYLKLQAMMGTDTTAAQGLAKMLKTAANYAADQELIKNVWDGDKSHTAVDRATATEIEDNAAARDKKREAFRNRTRGGAAGVSDAVAAAQADLDAATAAAAKAREDAEKERQKKKQAATIPEPEDVASLPAKVFSTFSATALQLAGVGSGGDKHLNESKKTNAKLDRMIGLTEEQIGFLRSTGATFE